VNGRRLLLTALLTSGTGAMDAIAFLGLGGVFASVMTGNLVVIGVGAADRRAELAGRAALALVGYVIGGMVGSRLARVRGVQVVLAVEVALLVAFAIVWEIPDGKPTGGWHIPLILLASTAMGLRSAAIFNLAGLGVSTTYLTGMLTAMIDDAVTSGPTPRVERGLPIFAAIVVGAAIGGWLVVDAPRLAPLFPLAVVVVVVALARDFAESR
jgi:uncharacterized membrane protein YoaK (UPF0700 family)